MKDVVIEKYVGNDKMTIHTLVYDPDQDDLIEYNDVDACGCNRGVHEAMRITGMTASQLLDICYPGKSPVNEDGSYYLRMYAGEGTGLFYKDHINHEYRIMYSNDGVEIVVSTHGSFPIYPFTKKFLTGREAHEYLSNNQDKLDNCELE